MTSFHPRALADKLEALLPELQRWSHRAVMALANAQAQQKRIEDSHTQTSHSARIHEFQLVLDQEQVQRDEGLLQVCERNCQETLAEAQQTASIAQSVLNETQLTYNYMQQALLNAQIALEQAQQAMQQATEDVESKQQALNRVVARAAGDKEQAANNLKAAQTSLHQASSNVRVASTDVANYEKAVSLASEALQIAQVAQKKAQEGLKASEDSMEFVRAASKAMIVGKHELGEEAAAVKATLEALQHAMLIMQESSSQLVVACSHEQSAQLHASDTLRILPDKIGLLILLNRPELDIFSDAMGASLSSGVMKESEVERVITRSTPAPNPKIKIQFHELERGAKRIVRELYKTRSVDLGSGARVADVRAASEFLGREIAVVQSKETGALRAVLGETTSVSGSLLFPDEIFIAHTHPVYYTVPYHLLMDIKNAEDTIEVVIDWSGTVTHFNRHGIVKYPPISPINRSGYIVGYH